MCCEFNNCNNKAGRKGLCRLHWRLQYRTRERELERLRYKTNPINREKQILKAKNWQLNNKEKRNSSNNGLKLSSLETFIHV